MFFAELAREVRKTFPDIGDGRISRIIRNEDLGKLVPDMPKLKTYTEADVDAVKDKLKEK